MPGYMPVLIGIDVSLPSERPLSTRLDLLGLATAALAEEEPVVLIIGHAVARPATVAAEMLLERAA